MSFTYDPTTDFGKVRLLCQDFDTNNQIFLDTEIQAFLDLTGGVIRYAAAQALEVIAASEVYTQKRIRALDLWTDGPAEATELRNIAKQLRDEEDQGYGGWVGLFDWAELVYNEFTQRERLINQALRGEGT